MPSNPFSKGRNTRGGYDDRNASAPKTPEHGESPLAALRHLGDKLRPHTAVTSTEQAPGRHSTDTPAGTSVPVASRARADAQNAGARTGTGRSGTAGVSGSYKPSKATDIYGSNSSANGSPNGTSETNDAEHPDGEPSVDQRANQQSGRTQNVMKQGAEDQNRQGAPNPDGTSPSDAADRGELAARRVHGRSGGSNEFDFGQDQATGAAPKDSKATESTTQAKRLERVKAAGQNANGPGSGPAAAPGSASAQGSNQGLAPAPEFQSRLDPGRGPSDSSASVNVNANANGKPASNASSKPNAPGAVYGGSAAHGGPVKPVKSHSSAVYGGPTTPKVSKAPDHVTPSVAVAPVYGGTPKSTAQSAHGAENGSVVPSETNTDLNSTPATSKTQSFDGVNGTGKGRAGAATGAGARTGDAGLDKSEREMKELEALEQPGQREITSKFDASAGGKADETDLIADQDEVKVPNDVPGLDQGSRDPGLPGRKDRPTASPDYDQKKIDQKEGSTEEKLREDRLHQSDYVGWRQVGGWDPRSQLSRDEATDLLQRSSLLEEYISDKYIGDWYQNAALIIGTAFFAWLVGKWGGSISWLSIILLFSATVYRTSIRRLRRNYRDDVLREMSLRKIESDSESMEWLNSFLIKFWVIYEPSLAEMITQIANEVLKESTPPFIQALTLEKFTLGTKAPRIEFVRSFPKTDPSVAVMDWSASFTPNDVMDLTARQLKSKVNPKVQLGVRIGKGFVSKSLPILVEDMSFSGTFRLRFKMMSRFPHIETVDFSFLEPPNFDFVLKPIGGDTFGFDINIIPGLSKFIKEIVHANLGPMFYAPNAFQVNLEQLMAGVGVMSGIGVLSIKLDGAKKLRPDRVDGMADPYVRILSQDKKELARTKIKSDVTEPVWNETLRIIVTSLSDTVLLEIMDFNERHVDRSLGMLALSLNDVIEEYGDQMRTDNITSGGKKSGELTYGVHYSPVQMNTSGNPNDSAENGARDTKSGILSLKVVGARNLDSRLNKVGLLSTFAEIELNGKLRWTTKTAKSSNDPEWQFAKEEIIVNKSTSQLVIRVRDNRGKKTPQIAVAKLRVPQLLLENEKGNTWFQLEPEDSGELQIEAQWKPVALPDVAGSSYIEPVGVVRLHIISATDLRNLEHVGKIDPYVRVFLNNSMVARTDFFNNTLSPVFDEFLYVPVQNELQTLTLEVMDVEKRARDRSLGFFKLDLKSVMQKDSHGNYKIFISEGQLTSRLAMPDRGPKGTLTYAIEFYPTVPIVSPDEAERVSAEYEEIGKLKLKEDLTDKDKEDIEVREERLVLAGVNMPLEKQLQYTSGVVAFSFGSVDGIERGMRLRITRDNIPHPIYISPSVKGRHFMIGESADYVTGQLGLTSIRIQIVDQDNIEDPRRTEGEVTVGAVEALRDAYFAPKKYSINSKASLSLTCRFFPMPDYVIDPSEDITNTGSIEVELIRANEIEAADTSGTSDPYVAFYINDSKDKVYKSQIIKKTLNPEWNEHFRFDIENIKETNIKALLYDWDMGNRDDYLGGAVFDASELEPLVWKSYKVGLTSIKKGKHEPRHPKEREGTLELRLRHTPGILQVRDDEEIIGAKSVTKTAGAAVAAGAGIGSHVHNGGHKVLGVLPFGRRSVDSSSIREEELIEYSVSVEKVTGLAGVQQVQLRAFTMSGREKEVYKSKTVKVEEDVAMFEDGVFDVKAVRNEDLGFKLREVKGLGRHHDIGQSTTELKAGDHKVDFGGGMSVRINITRS